MISIIVVYNNKKIFQNILLQSLLKQSVDYELIAIDNTKTQFPSAAAALNYGASKALGEYFLFVHQDIDLNSSTWLKDTEMVLNEISYLGIAGVVGMSEIGTSFVTRWKGHICDGIIPYWSKKLETFEIVQTLDECLIIIPKKVFTQLQFDSKIFDGWHCYGIDYCLAVKMKLNLNSYVIPMFVIHKSKSANINNLYLYQKRILNKYKGIHKCIYTTCGTISMMNLPYLRLKNIFIKLPIIFEFYHYLNCNIKRFYLFRIIFR